MRELISFFVRNSKWFFFLLYVVLSCVLLFSRNPYQHHVYLTTANSAVATVYGAANEVYSYFNLRQANNDLNERNALLQAELISLQNQVLRMQEDTLANDTALMPEGARRFEFVVAHVVSNSVAKPYNYITLNKGELDGVKPEMGVVDQNGVVGIVNVVGPHYSRVISLLNPNLKLSCKIKGNSNFGSLSWTGSDPRYATLEELPKHTVFHPGDTVVTSGYSAVFPEGLPVGVVEEGSDGKNDNFFTLKVKLFTDFATLSNAQVVINNDIDELNKLAEADYKPAR